MTLHEVEMVGTRREAAASDLGDLRTPVSDGILNTKPLRSLTGEWGLMLATGRLQPLRGLNYAG